MFCTSHVGRPSMAGMHAGWTQVPGVKLAGTTGDFRLELDADKVEVAFNDGKDDWDTPSFGVNYQVNGPGSYRITSGKVKKL